MSTPRDRPEFFLMDGLEVGLLEGSLPRNAGEIAYEPYRGPGHYDLSTALRRGEAVWCEVQLDGARVRFLVDGCPSYGVLSVRRVSTR